MSTTSASSSLMNSGQSSAKSQTRPMTALSAPHPLLKSSRGRVLWPEQRLDPNEQKHRLDDDLDAAQSRTRQRTSSVTSIETIRLRVKPRAADALLKPKLPLDEPTIAKRSVRKRTHSATSPEVDDDDSGAPQTGPRFVRQRRDSNFASRLAPRAVDEQLKGPGKGKMQKGASSALKKLKEKFTPPAQGAEVCDPPRDDRPALSPKSTPPVEYTSKTENACAPAHPVAFPSKQAGASYVKATPVVSERSAQETAQPLQSLSTNTETKRAPVRLPITGASLNKYGCYELRASEFEVAITFPSSARSNFEVWDQEDDLFVVGPLSLHLTVKDPAKWDGIPISHPDVSVLEIRCTSKAVVDSPSYPYCAAAAASTNRYSVHYEGAKTRSAVGNELLVNPKLGIAADTIWLRTYAADTAYARERNANEGRRGWEMQFYVPIATRLFDKRETRAFQVEGLILVAGQKMGTEVATMSVSHLMREREMVRR
ncbi:hypothetical protein C8R43DRAFT_1016870 [Mycena crocata]|nr:hypothetical protein C8R43DRAFT_1016870 [Mycena crocata]